MNYKSFRPAGFAADYYLFQTNMKNFIMNNWQDKEI